MLSRSDLDLLVDGNIYSNSQELITGPVLNTVLKEMTDSLYRPFFAYLADPSGISGAQGGISQGDAIIFSRADGLLDYDSNLSYVKAGQSALMLGGNDLTSVNHLFYVTGDVILNYQQVGFAFKMKGSILDSLIYADAGSDLIGFGTDQPVERFTFDNGNFIWNSAGGAYTATFSGDTAASLLVISGPTDTVSVDGGKFNFNPAQGNYSSTFSGANAASLFVVHGGSDRVSINRGTTTATTYLFTIGDSTTLSASSGSQGLAQIVGDVSQSSTAGYTGLLVNLTETSTGSATKLLADFRIGSSTLFRTVIDNKANFGMGSISFGINATNTFAIADGTAPTTSVSSAGLIYAEEIITNNVAIHTRDSQNRIMYFGEKFGMRSNHNLSIATNNTTWTTLDTSGRWGYLTNAPTHTLTQGSTGTGYVHYNTADQVTNFRSGALGFDVDSNFTLSMTNGGSVTTGATRIVGHLNGSSEARIVIIGLPNSNTGTGSHLLRTHGAPETSNSRPYNIEVISQATSGAGILFRARRTTSGILNTTNFPHFAIIGASRTTANEHRGYFWIATNPNTSSNLPVEVARFDDAGNFLLGGTDTPTSATKSFVQSIGVAPSANLTGTYSLYCDIISPGNATAHIRAENGEIMYFGEKFGMRSNHNLSIATNNTEVGRWTVDGNLLLGTTTESGRKVLAVANGNAPSTASASLIYFYSANDPNGDAAPHWLTAANTVIKLYTHTALTTTIAYSAPTATQVTPWGFASQTNFNNTVNQIANNTTRLDEIETRLKNFGLLP
jgi:hypothetical protein